MSVKYLRRWAHGCLDGLDTRDRIVWLCLANFCDEEGSVQIAQSQIHELTGLSLRSVIRSIQALSESGHVQVVSRGRYDRSSSKYIVLLGDSVALSSVPTGHLSDCHVPTGQVSGCPVTTANLSPSTLHNGSAPSLGGEGALPSNGTRAKLDPRTSYPPPDRRAKDWEVKAPRFFTHEITRRTLVMLDAGESLEAIEAERHSLVAEAVNGVPKIGQRPLPDYIPPPWPEEAAANATP